jgi:small GTP-binding protein
MLGDFAVGKTSLVRQFVDNKFDDKYLSTIGVKISRRSVQLDDGQQVNLLLWDLAGSEDFTGVKASYLGGTAGALLVCDLTRQYTLESIKNYRDQLHTASPEAELLLLGNKNDLTDEHQVTTEMLETFAEELSIPYFKTSAKVGENVAQAFQTLAEKLGS